MISASILQQNPSFGIFKQNHIKRLLSVSKEMLIQEGDFLFHKGDVLEEFYLVLDGEFEILFETPKIEVAYDVHGQPSELKTEHMVLSVVNPGEITGWSALVTPYQATSGCRARRDGTVASFNCQLLFQYFEEDCEFGFYMIQTAAQVIGKRLSDIYKGKQ